MRTDRTVTKPSQSGSEDPGSGTARKAGRRGLGTVFLRGRIWWVQVYVRNRSHRESSGSTNRADAVRLLKRRLAEAGKGQLPSAQAERLTIEQVATILFDDYAANERKTERDARR